jgi:hypothetical protein
MSSDNQSDVPGPRVVQRGDTTVEEPDMRTLGISCTPHTAYVAVAVHGGIVNEAVERIEVASLYEASEELLSTLDEVKRALGQLVPDAIALLMPEQGPSRRTYHEVVPRVALETLIRIAAVQTSIPIEVLARPTLRSRLGIDRSGDLASHVGEVVPTPVGRYWSAGRNLAALAALAAAKGVAA